MVQGKTLHDPGNRMNGVRGTYRSDGRFCPGMSSAVPGAASAEALSCAGRRNAHETHSFSHQS